MFADKVYQAQAAEISRLREVTRKLTAENEELRETLRIEGPFARMYRLLQGAIGDNPTLQNEWDRFCVNLRLFSEKAADPKYWHQN